MQMSSLFQRPATAKSINVICGALLGYAVYMNFYRIAVIDMVSYKIVGESLPLPPVSLLTCFILPSVLSMFLLEKLYYRICGKYSSITAGTEYCLIMLPLLGLAVFLMMPVNFLCPVFFIFIVGIVVFRYAAACFAIPETASHSSAKTIRNLRLCLIIIFSVMIAAGFYMQYLGLNVLYLLYYDWGVYLSIADNVLKGNGVVVNAGETSFLGSHFSPASILMLAPYVGLFYSKYAIFLLNSMLLYSCGPIIYYFARSKKIPEIQSLLLAGCIIFSPSLANMNLTLIYGFHDIYFFMPLLIMFFIFYEKGKYVPAFAIFGFTLMIKETVPVFWVGMGIALMLYGRRKTGLWMIIVGAVYWLTVVKLVIPWISGREVYDYAGRFDYLGNSLWQIALSPIAKPMLFWGHLFRSQCIFFGVLLLLPLFPLCINRPVLLVGGIISFVFICLQSSDQLQNICMQYQAEILALIFINCVFALDELNHSGKQSGTLIKFLAASAGANCRHGLACAALAGTIVTTLLAFYFFGHNVIGKNSFMLLLKRKNWSGEIAQIKTLIPEKVPINATMNLAGHFILRNEVYPKLMPIQNYVLMDLNTDLVNKKEMDQSRQKLLADGYKVIFTKAAQGKHIVLFAKAAAHSQSVPDNIFTLKNETEWDLCGNSVPVANPDFKLKVKCHGKILILYIRPAARLKYDADIVLTLGNNKEFIFFNNIFGNGVTPAFNVSRNQVFSMMVKLPDRWDTCDKSRIEIIPRPAID